jgi:hypothetical protein
MFQAGSSRVGKRALCVSVLRACRSNVHMGSVQSCCKKKNKGTSPDDDAPNPLDSVDVQNMSWPPPRDQPTAPAAVASPVQSQTPEQQQAALHELIRDPAFADAVIQLHPQHQQQASAHPV